MASNLNELAKVTSNPLYKAVIQDLLRQSKVLQMAPIESVPGFKITTARWQTLPASSTRAINGSYTETEGGLLENVQETLHIYGGDITVDSLLSLDKTVIEDPMATQTKMKVASIAAKFNSDFINNTHAIDPLGFVGLRERVANAPTRQSVDLGTGGTTLKILADAASEHAFIDGLHQLLHVIGAAEDPANSALFMNESTYLAVGKVLRRLSLLDTSKDQYDRVWKEFAGVKLVDIGLKYDQTTEIISSTLYADTVGTEIYGCRWNGDDGLHVIQLEGTSPEPKDPTGNNSELDTRPAKLRRIDWAIGLENRGKYAVGKLYGFKPAAS